VHIELTSRHGEVAADVRQLIEQKAQKLLHVFERVTALQVTVDMEPRLGVEVEIVVDVEGADTFVAHAAAQDSPSDALTAFEAALHKIEGQLIRHKQRLQDHQREVPLGELTREEERDEQAATGRMKRPPPAISTLARFHGAFHAVD